jgi:alkanesulfonate monooxygenase SsuD/methylene tetrahydromethanopterin reductase-like flavin-dependent oxidoreductase (luciferase family)
VALKFGWLFPIRNPAQWRRPWDTVYEEMLEQVEAAEALGYDSVWMSEHHGIDDGYCPSVLVAAAAAATRTKTITVGTRLLLLPLHHPVRVAEDAALVDILSKGRFILGMAIGYRVGEFAAFGVNRKHRPSLMDEGVEIIRRCWTENDFDYLGKRFQLRGVRVEPKPVQPGGPPIWLGARGGGAIERVARMGDGFHMSGGYDEYLNAMTQHGRDPFSIPIAESRDVYVAESAEQAWSECRDHFLHSSANYGDWFGEAADLPGDAVRYSTAPEAMRERLFVGTPEDVVERYRERLQTTRISHSIMRIPPGMEHGRVLRFMELFAREVMPKFRD